MGCVRVDIAAAVRAKHLDRDLRSHRSLHNRLRSNRGINKHWIAVLPGDRLAVVIELGDLGRERFNQRGRGVRLEILDHALPDEEGGVEQADWQKQVKRDPREIAPEVADRFGTVPGDAAHKSRGDGDAGGRREPVMKRQGDHL